MKCTDKEWQTCRVEKMGCDGCYYDDKDERMMDILQSFVDLADPQLDKYENLKEDVEATKWAIQTIKTLKNRVKELEQINKEQK